MVATPGARLLDTQTTDIHSPQVRRAGGDWLSLALMDARNHSLRWASVFEQAIDAGRLGPPSRPAEIDPPLWTLGHIGWYQERWVARNVQRQRGAGCDPGALRLPSIEPEADRWYDPVAEAGEPRWGRALQGLQSTRQYLADTIEITLELLSGTDASDAALHFYRMVLLYEDRLGEALAVAAQNLGMAPEAALALLPPWLSHAPREPLHFPATRWTLGRAGTGFAFDHELPAHELRVPEFDIDAQPVSWAQYTEFVEDGGYDEARWWSAEAWAWLQREGRRMPRHVLQMRQGVMQQRFGRSARVALGQPVVHVNAWEAEAWCRWAGRRLPSELEWEVAAHQGASRGFRWGEVQEWTATTLRPYPGFVAHPDGAEVAAAFGTQRAMRGASWLSSGRLRDPKLRRWAPASSDVGFFGFRSCPV
jgi:gamma-glutamyl hercynylcysteine S-oxide synthase